MNLKKYRPFGLLLGLLALTSLACVFGGGGSGTLFGNDLTINVYANSSLAPWLNTAVSEFNASNTRTESGETVGVELITVDAGTAVTQIQDGNTPALWIPDETVWASILADQGVDGYQGNCVSIAESPLVIGMWRSVAESLGWPGLPLGWLDVGSLAGDPSAWNYYSGGEYGETFRLGHTHPGLSGTGVSTLLAIVQSAQAKTDAVTTTDIEQPIVQASVGAFEGGVAWFSAESQALGQTMSERGISYLGAGVMHESTVLQYGGGQIVPIYPLEGTFVADHPACVNENAAADQQEAAVLFRDFLLSTNMQSVASANGLRPVNDEASIQSPLDPSFGVDLSQPEIVFEAPSVETVYAVQELWQSARKDVNLVMLLDTSGSMRGSKMDNMREAAVQFVEQMGDDDRITLIAFSTQPVILIQEEQLAESRSKVINVIQRLEASGDTSLFDAIALGAEIIANRTAVDTTDALVVLTDGQDTASLRFDGRSAAELALNSEATVFTIAYGRDADENTLSNLAENANGNFFIGDEASIAAIYEEMSAAFGGSVGVGR